MDFILIFSFVFAIVYLAVEQVNANAAQRFVKVRGRSTVTATKWGVVLSVHPNR